MTASFWQVPPNLLVKHGVSVTRTVQQPGQFLVEFPRSYTSSVCTGYSLSESVFFAPPDYVDSAGTEFQNIRESAEPMMFPLAKLLVYIAEVRLGHSFVEETSLKLPNSFSTRRRRGRC